MAQNKPLSSDAQIIMDAVDAAGGYLIIKDDGGTDMKKLQKELTQAGLNVVNIKGVLHVRQRN